MKKEKSDVKVVDIESLPKWEQLKELDAETIRMMAVDKIKEVYATTGFKDQIMDDVLDKLFEKLEDASGYKRDSGFFAKYLTFLANDIVHSQMINPNAWFMSTAQVDEYVTLFDYRAEFDKHNHDESFPFKSVEDYSEEMNYFYYQYCIDSLFESLKAEIARMKKAI